MRFVICDDNLIESEMIGAILLPIKASFPDAEIIIVHSFEEAIAEVNKYPAPDCVLMDYVGVIDGQNNTRLTEIEERSPVIIVTNHDPDIVKSKINRPIKVLSKGAIIRNHGILYRALLWAMETFGDKRYASHRAAMQRLRDSVIRDATPT